ncbi:MAG: sugar kinase [Ignavibacteriae bacterium]|nr:MAG: sugar kinase [Ignavibacteriota bacterium]
MEFLVVGSVGLDDVETPFGKVEKALGGAATYISLSASYFVNNAKMCAVVGEDFSDTYTNMLKKHNINLDALKIVKGGKTFRWGGKYRFDLNTRDTLFTELNVFEKFNPQIPQSCEKDSCIILGNILPSLQLSVINQLKGNNFIVTDTMNLWIDTTKEDLLKVLKKTDALIINDSEARMLTNEANLIKAAKMIRKMGPEYLIIKKGEHGALLFTENEIFSAPAYPLENLFDPTGAGDTFLGGFAGYLHKCKEINFENLKRAVIFGSSMASFCVEKFSTEGLENLNEEKIKDRFLEFKSLSSFDYE